jgi:hypothetical protein
VKLHHPVAALHTREVERIPGTRVVGEPLAGLIDAREIDLVDDDPRRKIVSLGNHQEPVEHPWMRLGVGRREDDDYLVDVRGDHALPPTAPRSAPSQPRATREDLADHPARVSVIALEHHFVANGELDGHAFILLETSAHRSCARVAALGADLPDAAGPLEH